MSAKGVARDAHVARQNRRRLLHRRIDSNGDSEGNEGLKLEAKLPIRRSGDCDEYCIKADISRSMVTCLSKTLSIGSLKWSDFSIYRDPVGQDGEAGCLRT